MRRACRASLLVRRCYTLAPLIAAQPRPPQAAALSGCCSLRRSCRTAPRAEVYPGVWRCSTQQLHQARHRQISGVCMAASPASAAAAASAELPQADEQTGTGVGGARSEDVILQYVVLRRDLWTELSWPLGSVVAQASVPAAQAMYYAVDMRKSAAAPTVSCRASARTGFSDHSIKACRQS